MSLSYDIPVSVHYRPPIEANPLLHEKLVRFDLPEQKVSVDDTGVISRKVPSSSTSQRVTPAVSTLQLHSVGFLN